MHWLSKRNGSHFTLAYHAMGILDDIMEGWRTVHIDWNQASQGHVQKLAASALMMLVMKMEPRRQQRSADININTVHCPRKPA